MNLTATTMKHSQPLVVGALLLGLIGCGNRNGQAGGKPGPELAARVIKPPKDPPKVPPRKDVPLDPALVAAARQQLEAAARSPDATLRSNALEAMRDVPDDVSSRSILKGLEDEKPIVRFTAAMAAGELRLADAKQPLLGMVDDPDPNVQIAVRFALHKLGDTRYSHDLEKTARDENPGVRGNTALALGLLGEKSGLKILKVLRTDVHAAVRQQASEAMWRLGDASARDDLLALTVSGYADDQMIGYLALAGPRKPEVSKFVSSGLVSDYQEVSLVAARAMGMLGSDAGYGVALKGAKSGQAAQRFLAALAFGAIGRTDAQPLLRDLVKDKDPKVRVAAAAAVLQLTPEAGARVAGARAAASTRPAEGG
jgi:HEAT repeat protein